MTTTWTVDKIEVENAYNMVNSFDVTIPTGYQTVWNSTDDWNDGPTGSVQPVTLKNPRAWGLASFNINVYGDADFPDDWRGASYVLTGYFERRLVFQGPTESVPDSGSTVEVKGLWLLVPDFRSRQVDIPFRYGGDFAWVLWLYKDSDFSDWLISSQYTRLEICWVRASCPQGPFTASSDTEKTHVDMRPGYPIILMRLFAPPPSELPDYQADDVQSFIKRAVITKIWNPCPARPVYDTWGGSSWYGASWNGGSFYLKDWVYQWCSLCNCYDIASISQLACSLLIDENRDELADSGWVYQWPNGYIEPGPLIGWVKSEGDHLRCNNPFWWSTEGLVYVDPDDPTRTQFGNHAWVEVTASGVRGVLDACHALRAIPPIPPCGELTRQTYVDVTLDQSKTHGNAVAKNSTNDGNCYLNPDYTRDRIGVRNWGQSTSSSSSTSAAMAMPAHLAAEIATLVERGAAPTPIEREFNRVDLAAGRLGTALGPELSLLSTSTTIALDMVRTTAKFQHDDGSTLVVSFNTFDSLTSPMNALISHLAGISARPLHAVVRTDEPHLGAYSFHIANSTVWLRGNLLARVDYFTEDGPTRDRPHLHYASRLDNHLASGPTVGPLPNLQLDLSNLPPSIEAGRAFRIRLLERERFAALTSISDNLDVLVPRGPPEGDGSFMFYPQTRGKAKITILAAATGSMRPLQSSLQVSVDGLGVGELSSALEHEAAATTGEPADFHMAPPLPKGLGNV